MSRASSPLRPYPLSLYFGAASPPAAPCFPAPPSPFFPLLFPFPPPPLSTPLQIPACGTYRRRPERDHGFVRQDVRFLRLPTSPARAHTPCEAADGTFATQETACVPSDGRLASADGALSSSEGTCSSTEGALFLSEGTRPVAHAAFAPARGACADGDATVTQAPRTYAPWNVMEALGETSDAIEMEIMKERRALTHPPAQKEDPTDRGR